MTTHELVRHVHPLRSNKENNINADDETDEGTIDGNDDDDDGLVVAMRDDRVRENFLVTRWVRFR